MEDLRILRNAPLALEKWLEFAAVSLRENLVDFLTEEARRLVFENLMAVGDASPFAREALGRKSSILPSFDFVDEGKMIWFTPSTLSIDFLKSLYHGVSSSA